MAGPQITIYGAYWCPDCRRSKQFLGEFQIPYRWVNIEEDQAGEQYVLAKNGGKRTIPTIEFADGARARLLGDQPARRICRRRRAGRQYQAGGLGGGRGCHRGPADPRVPATPVKEGVMPLVPVG